MALHAHGLQVMHEIGFKLFYSYCQIVGKTSEFGICNRGIRREKIFGNSYFLAFNNVFKFVKYWFATSNAQFYESLNET